MAGGLHRVNKRRNREQIQNVSSSHRKAVLRHGSFFRKGQLLGEPCIDPAQVCALQASSNYVHTLTAEESGKGVNCHSSGTFQSVESKAARGSEVSLTAGQWKFSAVARGSSALLLTTRSPGSDKAGCRQRPPPSPH